jgi:hypothetical protein
MRTGSSAETGTAAETVARSMTETGIIHNIDLLTKKGKE